MKVFILSCTLLFSLSFALSAKAQVDQTLLAVSDTSQQNQTKQEVKVIRASKPIIAKMGEDIELDLDATVSSTVRLHSSLGRLIHKVSGVNSQVKLKTDKLLPGVYMLIIKKPNVREIHKVLLTSK